MTAVLDAQEITKSFAGVTALYVSGEESASQIALRAERLKLPAFESAIQQRAAYMEIGLSGLPPHFAEQGRATVAKAVAEIDALVDEIGTLVGGLAAQQLVQEVA